MDIIDQIIFADPTVLPLCQELPADRGQIMMKALVLVAATQNGKWNVIRSYAKNAKKKRYLHQKQLITNEPLRQLFPRKFRGVNTLGFMRLVLVFGGDFLLSLSSLSLSSSLLYHCFIVMITYRALLLVQVISHKLEVKSYKLQVVSYIYTSGDSLKSPTMSQVLAELQEKQQKQYSRRCGVKGMVDERREKLRRGIREGK